MEATYEFTYKTQDGKVTSETATISGGPASMEDALLLAKDNALETGDKVVGVRLVSETSEFYDKVVEVLKDNHDTLHKILLLRALCVSYHTEIGTAMMNENLRDAFGTVGLEPLINRGKQF